MLYNCFLIPTSPHPLSELALRVRVAPSPLGLRALPGHLLWHRTLMLTHQLMTTGRTSARGVFPFPAGPRTPAPDARQPPLPPRVQYSPPHGRIPPKVNDTTIYPGPVGPTNSLTSSHVTLGHIHSVSYIFLKPALSPLSTIKDCQVQHLPCPGPRQATSGSPPLALPSSSWPNPEVYCTSSS